MKPKFFPSCALLWGALTFLLLGGRAAASDGVLHQPEVAAPEEPVALNTATTEQIVVDAMQPVEEIAYGATKAALQFLVIDQSLSKNETLRIVRQLSTAIAEGAVVGADVLQDPEQEALTETIAASSASAAMRGNLMGTDELLTGYHGLTRQELIEAVETGVNVGVRIGSAEIGVDQWKVVSATQREASDSDRTISGTRS